MFYVKKVVYNMNIFKELNILDFLIFLDDQFFYRYIDYEEQCSNTEMIESCMRMHDVSIDDLSVIDYVQVHDAVEFNADKAYIYYLLLSYVLKEYKKMKKDNYLSQESE